MKNIALALCYVALHTGYKTNTFYITHQAYTQMPLSLNFVLLPVDLSYLR